MIATGGGTFTIMAVVALGFGGEGAQVSLRSTPAHSKRAMAAESFTAPVSADSPSLIGDPDLECMIQEAARELEQRFGAKRATLQLKAVQDPEVPDAETCVVLAARTDLGAARAEEILDQFDDEWWLERRDRFLGRLEVTVELV